MNNIHVLLLRGVNVGGANRLPMPEFRQFLTETGLGHVQTYVQSGNVVFEGQIQGLEPAIAAGMKLRFGFAPRMFVYTFAEYMAIVAANPFAQQGAQDGKAVHVYFLAQPLPPADGAAMAELAGRDEKLYITSQAAYLYAPGGVERSVLAEKLGQSTKVEVTARNYTAVMAVAALAQNMPG